LKTKEVISLKYNDITNELKLYAGVSHMLSPKKKELETQKLLLEWILDTKNGEVGI
jgi:hypothetical protein